MADGNIENNGEKQTSCQEPTLIGVPGNEGLDGPGAEKGYTKNTIQGKAKHATRVNL